MLTFFTTLLAQSSDIPLGGFTPPTESYSAGSADGVAEATGNLELFISNLIGFLTVLGGIFFVVYFVMAAFSWITAGGDSGKISTARDKMVQGVLGLIIIIVAYSLIGLIGGIIGLDLLNVGQQIETLIPGGGTP